MTKRRGHNEGSFYELPDGQWRGAITVHEDDGTVKRLYFRGKSKREVQKKANAAREQLQRGAAPQDGTVLLKAYLVRWLEDVAKPTTRPRTYDAYKLQVQKLSDRLGGTQLGKLSAAQIQKAYSTMLQDGAAPASVHLAHAVLHRSLKQAKRWKLVPVNVAEDIDLPRVARQEQPTLTAAQVRTVLDYADDESGRLAPLWTLLAFTGLRLGEALGIRWQDLDFGARRLTLRVQLQQDRETKSFLLVEPKSKSGRRPVVLTERTIMALEAHRARQDAERQSCALVWPVSDLVFRNELGEPYPQIRVYRDWVRLLRATELPRVKPHSLRHGAASLLLAEGVHPHIVQEMLGHSSSQMTMDVYSHVMPVLHDEAAARMEGLLKRRD